MPTYQAGDHKVDHPPLFACREHKQLLRFKAEFIEEILAAASNVMPSNLSDAASSHLSGYTEAFKLNEYLIPPRVVIYDPKNIKGPAGLPFTLIFIDKRFIGIPSPYLTRRCFDGCGDCEQQQGLSDEDEVQVPEPPARPAAPPPRAAQSSQAMPARPASTPAAGVPAARPKPAAANASGGTPAGGKDSGAAHPASPSTKRTLPPPAGPARTGSAAVKSLDGMKIKSGPSSSSEDQSKPRPSGK